jgi:predicted RNA binding protein YcfA (HicA-like mRNA interferase family)
LGRCRPYTPRVSPLAPGFGAMKAKKLKKALCRQLGYEEVRVDGSHSTLHAEGRPPLTFAFHNGIEIGPAMVRQILVKQVGLSLSEAKEVYRRA